MPTLYWQRFKLLLAYKYSELGSMRTNYFINIMYSIMSRNNTQNLHVALLHTKNHQLIKSYVFLYSLCALTDQIPNSSFWRYPSHKFHKHWLKKKLSAQEFTHRMHFKISIQTWNAPNGLNAEFERRGLCKRSEIRPRAVLPASRCLPVWLQPPARVLPTFWTYNCIAPP